MIKLPRVLAILLAVLAGAVCAAENVPDPDMSAFRYSLPVSVEPDSRTGIAEVSLSAFVLAKARGDLGDLRLAGPKGLVPYALRINRGDQERAVSSRPVRVFNRVFLPGERTCLVAEFEETGLRNFLDIHTIGANFRRKVKIEAGSDAIQWQVLVREGWVFAVPGGPPAFRADRVPMPPNNFRYYRIHVFNGPDDPENIEIEDIEALRTVARPPDLAGVALASQKVVQRPEKGYTEILLDLGYENLPLYDVRLAFADGNFLRYCAVFGRNRETREIAGPPRRATAEEPWSMLADGSIWRFTTKSGSSEFLHMECPGRCRYLSVRVYNRDDAPLSLAGVAVRRFRQYLDFPYGGAGAFTLFFGNPQATAPSYDLAGFVGRLREDGVVSAVTGPASNNPAYREKQKPVPWSERHAWLLTAAILAAILALGAMILRQIPKIRNQT